MRNSKFPPIINCSPQLMLPRPAKFSLLWLEDSENDVFLFSRKLEKAGMNAEILHVESKAEFNEALETGTWDIILADHDLPGFSPNEALERLNSEELDIPLIILSGVVKAEDAVALMRAGAKDFVSKDDISRLLPAIYREIEDHLNRKEKREASAELKVRNIQLADTLETLRAAQADALRLQRIRAVSEMASGVAHDFNNNLMKLSGLLSQIAERKGTGDLLDAHGTTFAAMAETLEDGKSVMRRISKFYDNNPNLEADEVDLIRAIGETIDYAKKSWQQNRSHESVRIVWNCDGPAVALTREADFQSALMNLITNAAEAMPFGGEIRLSIEPAPDHRYLLKIADTGVGMSTNELQRCREPFFSTKGEFGTGLGLGIADAVIQQYGGSLSINSTRNKGSNVSILLKEAEQATSEIRSRIKPAAPGVPARILIAEDEAFVGRLLKRFLEVEGHEVDLANSALEAMERFDPDRHSLIISDRSMPGMTGDELAVAIKKRSPETPFFMVTGFGDIMIARGESPEGVDRVLPKPIEQRALAAAVSAVLPETALAS